MCFTDKNLEIHFILHKSHKGPHTTRPDSLRLPDGDIKPTSENALTFYSEIKFDETRHSMDGTLQWFLVDIAMGTTKSNPDNLGIQVSQKKVIT